MSARHEPTAPPHHGPPRRSLAVALLMVLAVVAPMESATVRRFVLDTPRALAGARGSGVAVFPDGSMSPLAPLTKVAEFEEPLGLALAVADDGTAYVGTGHPARVWRLRQGEKTLVSEPEADQVTALLLAPNGDLYVSTAVPALLLRVPRGTGDPEVVSRLPEGNLWDLAWFDDDILAAAGNPGRILRLAEDGLVLLTEVPDTHARCLAVSGDVLLVGTSGEGRVLRWSRGGTVGIVHDSDFTEIAALAVADDGTVWAAALTGDPTMGKPSRDNGEASVTVSVGEGPASSQQGSTSSATSEILKVFPAGAAVVAHRFPQQIAGSLAWSDSGLVIGTGLEGELWQLVEQAAAQLDTVDAAQVVRVADGGDWVLTQGPVTLLRRSGAPHGTLVSPALDAGHPATWGQARLRGQTPKAGTCRVSFRSGASADPGQHWSAWTAPQPCDAATADAPPARYLQWKVELSGDRPLETRLGRVEVAYRQVNLPPEIQELVVHDPGEVYLKAPPPSDRILEVSHPDLSGIFTTLDDDDRESQDRLGKRYYRVGFQSVSWKAEDPNGDALRFTLEVQRAGSDGWWTVRDGLETVVLALDTQALPDGLYRFRLLASDLPENPLDPAVSSSLSSWVTVDNSPPRIEARRDGDDWVVTVEDALSPLALVEWNRDAEAWHPAVPADGLLDSTREIFRILDSGGAKVLAVRAVDDHHNRVTAALEDRP